jgi:hypothetical protein
MAWRGQDLRPGEKRPLQRADYKEFEVWWRDALKPAGYITRDRAQAFAKNKKGKFFASTPKPWPIASLASIRWKDFSGIILGQPLR